MVTGDTTTLRQRLVAQHRTDVLHVLPHVAADHTALSVTPTPTPHVLQQLVTHRVVGSERGGVRGGGLGAGLAAVRLDENDGLLLGGALDAAHERGSVVESLQVRPDLLDRGLLLVVVQRIELVDIAGITEGDELGNPALVVAAGKLVQQRDAQGTALREHADGTETGLGKTTREAQKAERTRWREGTGYPRSWGRRRPCSSVQ